MTSGLISKLICKEIQSNANMTELGEIINLEKETFGEHGGIDIWTLRPILRCGKVYVAIADDEIVSVAEYMPDMANRMFLYGFSTRVSAQNKGYGDYLLSATEIELSKLGINEIFLTVAPTNIKAINLYKKHGYENIGENPDEYGVKEPRLLMAKKL